MLVDLAALDGEQCQNLRRACGPSDTVNSRPSSIRTSLVGSFGGLEQALVDLAFSIDAAGADGRQSLRQRCRRQ